MSMYNENFFIFIAFLSLLALAFKPTKTFLLHFLKKYSSDVSNTILEAETIKKEAEQELIALKARAETISTEVEDLINSSKQEAEMIMLLARKKAEDLLNKKTQNMLLKISQHEEAVYIAIRDKLVEHVLQNVESSLSLRVDEKTNAELVSSGLKNIKKLTH